MKLSVIIPTFNRLELLQETLECVFGQTRPADEIIVVDDHSTDDTYEFLIAELAGKVIAIKCKGKGPGAARNTGLQAATGDLIKFFDSDDLMTRNLFEVQTAFLENSGESLVYSPYVHFSMENGVMTQRDVILQYRPIPKDVSLRDCVSRGFSTIIPSMMFRADFLKQVGQWRIDLSSYEDWDFLWRVASLVPNPAHTDACMVFYRIHGLQTSILGVSNTRKAYDKLQCLEQILVTPNLSWRERTRLKAELYKTRKLVDRNPSLSLFMEFVLMLRRMKSKRERLHTGTDWEIMYGVEKNNAVYENFVSLL